MFWRVLMRAACGLCLVGAAALPAPVATPAEDAAQADVNRGTIDLDRAPAKDASERAQIGNPLWAIPLGSLTITRERPLFTPARRPPVPAVAAAPRAVEPKPVARPVEPEHPNLTLIGTVVGKTDGIGVFLDQNTHDFVRLKTGEEHAGWVLRSIKAREATLEKAQRTETLSLPAPQETSAPASSPKRPE